MLRRTVSDNDGGAGGGGDGEGFIYVIGRLTASSGTISPSPTVN